MKDNWPMTIFLTAVFYAVGIAIAFGISRVANWPTACSSFVAFAAGSWGSRIARGI